MTRKKGDKQRRAGAAPGSFARLYHGQPQPRPPPGAELWTSEDLKELLRNKTLVEQEDIIHHFLSELPTSEDREHVADEFLEIQFRVAPYFADCVKATEAEASGSQGYRLAADLYWSAFEAATALSRWSPGRIESFRSYTTVPLFTKHHELILKKDYQRFKAVFYDPGELVYLRLEASIIIQLLPCCRYLSFEQKQEIQREASRMEAAPDELERKVFSPSSGGDTNVKLVRDLFQVAKRVIVTLTPGLSAERSNFACLEGVPESKDAELFRRTAKPGGIECDFCHQTVQELGVTRLDFCTRCKAAYYCGKDCQTAAWVTGGHKLACRLPDSRQVGDIIRIYGLKNAPKLNGRLVHLLGPVEDEQLINTGPVTAAVRWKVSLYAELEEGDDKSKIFSINTKNLVHIRPAK